MQDPKNVIDSNIHPSKFLNNYIDDHDFFAFNNIIKNDHVESLRLSPMMTRPQSRASDKLVFLTYMYITFKKILIIYLFGILLKTFDDSCK